MKKCCFALLLLLCAGFSLHAQSAANISIFSTPVTGFGRSSGENRAINAMLTNELTSRKYTLVYAPQGADFTLHGSLGIFDEYDDYENQYDNRIQPTTTYTFNAPTQEYYGVLYLFQLMLRNVGTGEVVLQNIIYASLDDVYNFFPLVMHNLFTHISGSGISGSGPAEKNDLKSDLWKDQWIYFRASLNYPITFYLLQHNGLKDRINLYNEETNNVSPIDNKVTAMPGATLGTEFQLLNFFSLELNLQLNMGDTKDKAFINTAMGLELKSPLKFFDNIMLVPYVAFLFSLNVSPVFSDFPRAAAGPGIQFCTRVGKHGAFFIDAKYVFSFRDAVMHNPYLGLPSSSQSYPEPAVIHYKRSQVEIGAGYKIGILDKKKYTATIIY